VAFDHSIHIASVEQMRPVCFQVAEDEATTLQYRLFSQQSSSESGALACTHCRRCRKLFTGQLYRWRVLRPLSIKKVATALVAFVALEHVYILVLEMFLWTKPAGLRAFGLTPEFAEQTAVLAANQGLYNGFLAAGLIWALMRKDQGTSLRIFFLCCVIVAGIFGATTAKPSILYVQAAPALIALIATLLARRQST